MTGLIMGGEIYFIFTIPLYTPPYPTLYPNSFVLSDIGLPP